MDVIARGPYCGCHGKRALLDIIGKGPYWMSLQKGFIGCHRQRALLDVIAKGPYWMSLQKDFFSTTLSIHTLQTCSNCVEIYTFGFGCFSPKQIIFSNQKIYTDELYGSSF